MIFFWVLLWFKSFYINIQLNKYKKLFYLFYPEHNSFIFLSSLEHEFPSKGKQPNIILYKITPKDQISTFKKYMFGIKLINQLNIYFKSIRLSHQYFGSCVWRSAWATLNHLACRNFFSQSKIRNPWNSILH